MKRTILAVSLAVIAGSALATGDGYSVGGVVGSVTSQSAVSVGSLSTASYPNQSSVHGAAAFAANCTSVQGWAGSGLNNAAAYTNAQTEGMTLTSAFGKGTGFAGAEAGQYGHGEIDAKGVAYDKYGRHLVPTGYAKAGSEVVTSTGSAAYVLNSGFAVSGSKGWAENTSFATASAREGYGSIKAATVAGSQGESGVKTFGFSTCGYGDGVQAGGVSGQEGYADAKINAFTFAGTSYLRPGTGNCVLGCGNDDDKGPKGNNGWGNGDQDAPGNSGDHNNAENNKDGRDDPRGH